MSISHFKIGNRCRDCGFKKGIEKKRKHTIDTVREYIKEQGETLITTTYNNPHDTLEIICKKCNQIYKTNFDRYRGQNTRCGLCCKNRKYDFSYVKQTVEKDGNKLISTEYKNSKLPLSIECNVCKTITDTSFTNFRDGHWCKICFNEGRRLEYNSVKDHIEKNGDKLLSLEYKNVDSNISVECGKCKNQQTTTFYKYKKGKWCKVCFKNIRFDYSYVKSYIENAGHKLISTEYVNRDGDLIVECSACKNQQTTSFVKYRTTKWCNRCKDSV
jgi:hypothetical protein